MTAKRTTITESIAPILARMTREPKATERARFARMALDEIRRLEDRVTHAQSVLGRLAESGVVDIVIGEDAPPITFEEGNP